VAPVACEAVRQLADKGVIALELREFQEADLTGQAFVVTATDSRDVNRQVFLAAQQRGLLCNSVDDPPNCDFYFASIVERGKLQIAISTAGESPALAQRLRREIDAQLPPNTAEWLDQLGALRREILATHPAGSERKALLHTLAERPVCSSDACPSRQLAFPELPVKKKSARTTAKKGTVYLVGAGPGDPELLTLKAADLLATADVVLHDDLVPQEILDCAGVDAQIISVGKRCGSRRVTQQQIHELMIQKARNGASVVRLKSGDPLIFGRAGEEIEALEQAQISCEIVPGVTTMFAAAAAARKSLTDRRSASKVILTTAHHASHSDEQNRPSFWHGPLPNDATLGIYMPGRDLRALAWDMLKAGLPADLPIVVMSHVSLPDQESRRTTLGSLGDLEPGSAPMLILAGWPLANRAEGAIADFVAPEHFEEVVGLER
ncbi:MAG TPA: uroporphyrinogen-III C-methyltransferase, partial [Acidobacteriaceae bacterium]|nr:uroporphyrinogen-III C-methyltransferase [Acidobacteriaceae bacterium]